MDAGLKMLQVWVQRRLRVFVAPKERVAKGLEQTGYGVMEMNEGSYTQRATPSMEHKCG